MKIVRRLLIVIVILLFCIVIDSDSINKGYIIIAKEFPSDSDEVKSEELKTDIAQVFITVDNTITKDDYTQADIIIVDEEGGTCQTIIDKDAEIKIRGNSTADLEKLPYNIKLSSSQSVLGMSSGRKWCLLANYMDTSLMRNKLAYDFARNIGLAYSCDSRYVDVYLNGEYQGNYLITVPVETGENRVDIDTMQNEYLLELENRRIEDDTTYFYTEMCRFKLDDPEELTPMQTDWLTEFFNNTETAIKSRDYAKISEYVDVDSFIDFYIVEELFKNLDVHTSSTRYYIKGNKLYAGPLWDCDLSSGNVALYRNYQHYLVYNNYEEFGNSSGNSFEGFWALNGGPDQNYFTTWIGNLMRCEEFQSRLKARYLQLQDRIVNLYENNTLGTNQMDLLLNKYANSFARDNNRWPVEIYRDSELYRMDERTFEDSVAFLRSWLKNRNQWLLEAFQKQIY